MEEVVMMLVLEGMPDVVKVLTFHEATGGKYRQQVLRRLMQLDNALAVRLLDGSCDVETCEEVLLHLPVDQPMSLPRFIGGLERMRRAGHKRSAALFQRALDIACAYKEPVFNCQLLAELKLEPDAEASVVVPPDFYYRAFNSAWCLGGLKEHFWVFEEAKRKHISLDGFEVRDIMVRILVVYGGAREAHVHRAAEMFVEVGEAENLEMAYEMLLGLLLSSPSSKSSERDLGSSESLEKCLETVLGALASQWRLLGYNPHSVDVFEAEVRGSTTVREGLAVFLKMDECDLVAPSSWYKKVADRCKCFGEAVEVFREVKRRGIEGVGVGDVFHRLLTGSDPDISAAVTLLQETSIGEAGIDGATSQVLVNLEENLFTAAAFLEAALKANDGVPFMASSGVFLSLVRKNRSYQLEERLPGLFPYVKHSV